MMHDSEQPTGSDEPMFRAPEMERQSDGPHWIIAPALAVLVIIFMGAVLAVAR